MRPFRNTRGIIMTRMKLLAVSSLVVLLAVCQTTGPRTAKAGSESDRMSAVAESKAVATAAQCDGKSVTLSYEVNEFPSFSGDFTLRFTNGGARIEDFHASNGARNQEGPVARFARQGDVVSFRSTTDYEYVLNMNGCNVKYGRAKGANPLVGSVSLYLTES